MTFAGILGTTAFILFLAAAAVQTVWLFRRDGKPDPVSHWTDSSFDDRIPNPASKKKARLKAGLSRIGIGRFNR